MAAQINHYTVYAALLPPFDVVVAAASAGGVEALRGLVSTLPADFPVPIVVAQHLSPDLPSILVDILNKRSALAVSWAKDGAVPAPGTVTIAPPGHHVKIGDGNTLSVISGPRVQFVRPSADMLFKSAAAVNKERTIGIVLSGSGEDGAAGARAIKEAGGRIIVQDPSTSRFRYMPQASLAAGVVDFALPVERISSALVTLCMVPGGAGLFYVPPDYRMHLPPDETAWWPQRGWNNSDSA